MDHKLTIKPLSTGDWDKRIGTWATTRDVYQKQTAPLLDAKPGAGHFVLVTRKAPCVKLVTISISMA